MEKKQLLIGIPTKNHPQYIQYYLSRALRDAKKHNIDICIYDSSDNDETKELVIERQACGYDNIFYKAYEPDIKVEDKLIELFTNSGYKYVWLCGDGVVINLEKSIEIVENEMKKERDLICFGDKKDELEWYKEYVEVEEYFKDCFAPYTLFGANIIKGNLLTEKEWHFYEKKYQEQCIQFGILDKLSNRDVSIVYIAHKFYYVNPFKKQSDWMRLGRTFEAFAKIMSCNIEKMPKCSKEDKEKIYKDIDRYTGVYSFSHLWALRVNGNLDFKTVMKYWKYINRSCICSIWTILLISLCPKKIADVVAIIYDNMW